MKSLGDQLNQTVLFFLPYFLISTQNTKVNFHSITLFLAFHSCDTMEKWDFSLDIFMHTDIITFNFLSKNQIISEDFVHLLHIQYICDSFLLIQAVNCMNLDSLHLTNKENT